MTPEERDALRQAKLQRKLEKQMAEGFFMSMFKGTFAVMLAMLLFCLLLLGGCVAIVSLADAAPAPKAQRCSGSAIVKRGSGVELRADRLRVEGGMTCRTGRAVVARFLRRQIQDVEGCAAPAAGEGTCGIGAYRCSKVDEDGTLAGLCAHESIVDRGVQFRERDRARG